MRDINPTLHQDRRDGVSMRIWEQGRAQGETRTARNLRRAYWGEDLARLRRGEAPREQS